MVFPSETSAALIPWDDNKFAAAKLDISEELSRCLCEAEVLKKTGKGEYLRADNYDAFSIQLSRECLKSLKPPHEPIDLRANIRFGMKE